MELLLEMLVFPSILISKLGFYLNNLRFKKNIITINYILMTRKNC